ncbi:MAG TPA: 2-phosphosulfolactate phosphatase [Thermomicrobiales bacterium]|jgi:2-phosphosulfolactate phosphatase
MMRIQVAFLPQLAAREPAGRGICIVIDILRATTTLTTLLEYGAIGVLVAPDAAAAREEKRRDPGALLLGEIGGLRPTDFDLGNSPRELSPANAGGRRAICHTSNGTAAIRAVAGAPAVLLGCLRNATAVAERAYALAQTDGLPVTIVCAGGSGGQVFALDDTLVAGQLVALITAAVEQAGQVAVLDDAAIAARTLFRAAVGDAPSPVAGGWEAALRRTTAGQHLTAIGLAEDIPFCAQFDTTTFVPLAQATAEQVTLAPMSAAR